MCPANSLRSPGVGCNQSVLPPKRLGRLWLQAADADGINAPELVTKRTFLEFEFSDKSPGRLSRCSSDGDIKYGGKSSPSSESFSDSQVSSPRSSEGCILEEEVACSQACSWNSKAYENTDHFVPAQERSSGQMPANIFVAVPFFVFAAKPTLSCGITEALNAKKAALGDTVARLSLAALKAETPARAKKHSSSRTARRAKKMQPDPAPKTAPRLLPSDAIDEQADSSTTSEVAEQTTIMLRNVPLTYTRTMLLDLLNLEGFKGRYDFLYLPSNFETSLGFGYAFVNFSSEDDAELARDHFQGFNEWNTEGEEVCETSWSDPYQGLAANVERYRNSPVMHESVHDKHKPIVFVGGLRQAFPVPNKLIKAPKTVHRSVPLSHVARLSGA